MYVVYTIVVTTGRTRIVARCDDVYDAEQIVAAYRRIGYAQVWYV